MVAVMKPQAHFGDDAWGKRKAFYFLPWHFAFFCR
jgi:tRNA-dihydrouridine synthase 3